MKTITDNGRNARQEEFPTHDEIRKRAHELYLARGGKDGQDLDDWLFAEKQLRREHGERVGTRTTTFVAGPGGVAKTSDTDFTVGEEERTAVRDAEEIKEGSTLPKTKAVAVGQRRNK